MGCGRQTFFSNCDSYIFLRSDSYYLLNRKFWQTPTPRKVTASSFFQFYSKCSTNVNEFGLQLRLHQKLCVRLSPRLVSKLRPTLNTTRLKTASDFHHNLPKLPPTKSDSRTCFRLNGTDSSALVLRLFPSSARGDLPQEHKTPTQNP